MANEYLLTNGKVVFLTQEQLDALSYRVSYREAFEIAFKRGRHG